MYAVADFGGRVGDVFRLQARLMGFQRWPPSSERNAPAEEIAQKRRLGLVGSSKMVCRHMPPAPGAQTGPVA